MQHRNAPSDPERPRRRQRVERKARGGPHPTDLHVASQLTMLRIQSDLTQVQLASAIGVSFQQLQKYENAKNRVSASMLYELAASLGVPVGRFFEGLVGNDRGDANAPLLPIDERITFIASAEGRRMIEGLMQLHPRVRGRVAALVATLGETLSAGDDGLGKAADETQQAERNIVGG